MESHKHTAQENILQHQRCWLHPPGWAGPQFPRSSDLMGSVRPRRSFPQHVEICLVVAGNQEVLVRRTSAGSCQEAIPKTGAIC